MTSVVTAVFGPVVSVLADLAAAVQGHLPFLVLACVTVAAAVRFHTVE